MLSKESPLAHITADFRKAPGKTECHRKATEQACTQETLGTLTLQTSEPLGQERVCDAPGNASQLSGSLT